MLKKLTIGLGVVLAACGGSDSRNLTDRYELQAEAAAWVNGMPTALLPGQESSCTPLIVRFTIVAKQSLPADISATSVSLSKNGSVLWTQDVSATETGFEDEKTIQGVARGCRTAAFVEGDTLTVKVFVKTTAEQSEVQTAVQLGFAS